MFQVGCCAATGHYVEVSPVKLPGKCFPSGTSQIDTARMIADKVTAERRVTNAGSPAGRVVCVALGCLPPTWSPKSIFTRNLGCLELVWYWSVAAGTRMWHHRGQYMPATCLHLRKWPVSGIATHHERRGGQAAKLAGQLRSEIDQESTEAYRRRQPRRCWGGRRKNDARRGIQMPWNSG